MVLNVFFNLWLIEKLGGLTSMSVLEDWYLIEEGGLVKFQKTLQEGGHFLIRGGSDKPKMLQSNYFSIKLFLLFNERSVDP